MKAIAQPMTAGAPGPYPALPAGMQRGQVEALLVELAPAIGLSGRRLQALLLMMGQTRPSDWVRPDTEPVCYMAQTEIARLLGKTERAVRADEAALSVGLALIEKRTAANGGRSSHGRLGLVFSRLIALVPELLQIRDGLRLERLRRKELIRLRSAFYRRAKGALIKTLPANPDHPDLCTLRDAFLAWPGTEELRAMSLGELETHAHQARALCDALEEYSANAVETSGQPEVCDRSHLQDTTEDEFVSCIAQKAQTAEHRHSDFRQGRRNGPAGEQPHTARHLPGESRAWLAPERMYRLASEDMRLRFDIERQRSGRLSELDFVVAAIKALPELGIHGSAWDEAAEAMGEYEAALCVAVTDANRTHPVTPVVNPGGHLRALTRRFRAGELNLIGSLIGLDERGRLAQQLR